MAIGRTFPKLSKKAQRGLEVGDKRHDSKSLNPDEIGKEISAPGPHRIWFVVDAFRIGLTRAHIHAETGIDPWFLAQIEQIVQQEQALQECALEELSADGLRRLK